jgi:hypothetical protein
MQNGVLFSRKEEKNFAEKWVEMKIIMYEKAKLNKSKIACFCSYMESRLKKIILMGHKCKRGSV